MNITYHFTRFIYYIVYFIRLHSERPKRRKPENEVYLNFSRLKFHFLNDTRSEKFLDLVEPNVYDMMRIDFSQ